MKLSNIPEDKKKIIVVILFITLLKLILLPYTQTVNPDAITRVFDSIKWLDNPIWIKQSVWGPFHFYLNAAILKIWYNPVFAPKILNIIFSSLTLIPFYYFTRREFNSNGAFIASIFLAISPILFRNSFMALSETPYLFFLASSINYISKGIQERKTFHFFAAGVLITIASGLRYEAWLIMAIIGIYLFFTKNIKQSVVFSAFALIFPIIWMVQSYLATGNFLFGIQGNYKWTLEVMNNNANLNFEDYLRRIWYFPFMWVISLGPPIAYILIKDFIKFKKNFQPDLYKNLWFILLIVTFVFFQYNAFKGVLLLQPRFVGTLILFSLPFVAHYFKLNTKQNIKNAIIFGFVMVSFSFFYNTSNVKPVPRLNDPSAIEVAAFINENSDINKDGLFIDFWNWQNTHFIGLHSGIHPNNIYILSPYFSKNEITYYLDSLFSKFETGILVTTKNSKLNSLINYNENSIYIPDLNQKIIASIVYESEVVVVYRYQK
jgi:4-amino-4-deoxy-L-arabinose transferase-like glycosyltransferase